MAFRFNYSEEKNQLLKASRGVDFGDVIQEIESGRLIDNIEHPNPKLTHQRMYIVRLLNYTYAVPYVINKEKNEIFLKTIYPSRVWNKKYNSGGKNE